MVPGALAFTYRNRIHLWDYPILLFCVLFLSGSVFLALIFSLMSLIVLPFGKWYPRVSATFPFLLFIAFLLFLNAFGVQLFISIINFLSGHLDFLEKKSSFKFRENSIFNYVDLALKNPLGYREALTMPAGFLISSVLKSSVFGMIIAAVVFVKIFFLTGKLFNEKGLYFKQRLAFPLIYGAFFVP